MTIMSDEIIIICHKLLSTQESNLCRNPGSPNVCQWESNCYRNPQKRHRKNEPLPMASVINFQPITMFQLQQQKKKKKKKN